MTHVNSKKHSKTIDYCNIYDRLMADVILVKVRQNMVPYVNRLIEWETDKVFPYAVTISPKSSPLLINKPLTTQYSILITYIKQTFPLYCNKYFFSFETYSDNVNIHCHGFVNFRTLQDIKKFRKDCRQSFNIQLKPHSKDNLTHVKLIGNDETARKRWIGYCYKEMEWSVINDIPPIYRWDDGYVKPIEYPKKNKIITSVADMSFININSRQQFDPSMYYTGCDHNTSESESESDTEHETTKEYLEYLRLKSKFEKKPLEKNI